MRPLEAAAATELRGLVRAGVPPRTVTLTVRDLVVARFERGPLGAREVSEIVEAMVRAACRLVREAGAPEELVELVCRGALDAVRGHGGESARWLDQATATARAVLDEMASEHADDETWGWVARRSTRW